MYTETLRDRRLERLTIAFKQAYPGISVPQARGYAEAMDNQLHKDDTPCVPVLKTWADQYGEVHLY